MYYLRISGRLRSDKQPSQRPPLIYQSNRPPIDVPPWHQQWPDQPPYEIQGKLRRRERSRSPKRYPPAYEQSYRSAQSMPVTPATSAEFARLAQMSQRRPPTRNSSRTRYPVQQTPQPRPYSQQPSRPTSVLKNHRSRSTTPAGFSRRKSPQRVSFKNRPKIYERTPESSLSGGGKLEIQTVV